MSHLQVRAPRMSLTIAREYSSANSFVVLLENQMWNTCQSCNFDLQRRRLFEWRNTSSTLSCGVPALRWSGFMHLRYGHFGSWRMYNPAGIGPMKSLYDRMCASSYIRFLFASRPMYAMPYPISRLPSVNLFFQSQCPSTISTLERRYSFGSQLDSKRKATRSILSPVVLKISE